MSCGVWGCGWVDVEGCWVLKSLGPMRVLLYWRGVYLLDDLSKDGLSKGLFSYCGAGLFKISATVGLKLGCLGLELNNGVFGAGGLTVLCIVFLAVGVPSGGPY